LKAQFLLPKYWPTWFGLFFLRLISSLPWAIVARFSDILGSVAFKFYNSRRLIAERNISACFPDYTQEQVQQTAKRSFQLGAQAIFFTGVAWWASRKRYKSLVQFDSHLIDECMEENQNLIILIPHFVGLELAGMSIAIDYEITSMFQYAKNELIHHFVETKRTRFGGYLVERKEPLRKLLKLLRKGSPFYYLPDQDAGRKGRFVPFFGIPASSYDMLGKMAKMSNAKVFPCSSEILENGKGLRVTLHPPLENFPTGDDDKDTTTQNLAMENVIRQMPEQYLWGHKRFKSRPDGEPPFYSK
jgi:KDO2-lipid IV(A) lauroyltransferase